MRTVTANAAQQSQTQPQPALPLPLQTPTTPAQQQQQSPQQQQQQQQPPQQQHQQSSQQQQRRHQRTNHNCSAYNAHNGLMHTNGRNLHTIALLIVLCTCSGSGAYTVAAAASRTSTTSTPTTSPTSIPTTSPTSTPTLSPTSTTTSTPTTSTPTTSSPTTFASPCNTDSWWNPIEDKCIVCTVCHGDKIPLRPCQLHRDTICGSIYDLKIDWLVLAKTNEPVWQRGQMDADMSELIDSSQQQHYMHRQEELHAMVEPLDWQTIALFLAVLACLLFFIVAACILIHHMRQWRRMERRLDQDVEELSTKLMAKLVEVQSFDGGTFFIGNADALRIPAEAYHTQRVLLPPKSSSAKHHHQCDRVINKSVQPSGNVYIEENGSKG